MTIGGVAGGSALFASVGASAPPSRDEWERYLSHHGRSFSMAARMMPQLHRAEVTGVYAWCRYTDDLVDHATCSRATLLRALDEWEALSRAAYLGRVTGIELLDVVIGEMGRRGVPFRYAEDLIRGMRMDVVGTRFDTLAALEDYCHDVASVVGLWLTELFGLHDPWTLERAGSLGVAMQLTNIARDVGEDSERGRLYLPRTMLDRHGVTGPTIAALRVGDGPVPEGYAALLEELMEAADTHYARAAEAIGALPPFFRSAVAVASRVYQSIHDAIRANGYDTIRRRAVTPDVTRMSLAHAALAALSSEPGARLEGHG